MALQSDKIFSQRVRLHLTQKNQYYYKKLHLNLSGNNDGVSVPINATSNLIFQHNNTEHLAKFLGEDISKDSVAQYMWSEACRKHQVAMKSGATAVSHCPIFIRLGLVIRKKMGYTGGLCDLLAKAFGLPTDRLLNDYEIPSANDPDGMMYKNIKRESEVFNRSNPGMDPLHHDRRVIVSYDAMSCKGRFVVGHHNNEMIGVAKDAFDKDIILSEMQEQLAMDQDGFETLEHYEKTKENSAKKPDPVPLAKHFLVLIATTISASAKHKHTFLVARYGLKTIDADRVNEVLTKSFIAIAKDGWIAIQVAGDGASENRSYCKRAATITTRELFDGHYDEDTL